jgi:hypothetical protein
MGQSAQQLAKRESDAKNETITEAEVVEESANIE